MMRSLVRSAIVVVALAATGFTQISFDFTGSGARAKAMGGAFLGVSDDVTAGTWNPAGLWVHEGPKLGLDYGTLLPRGESVVGLYKQSQSGSWNSFGALNFVAPVRIKGHQFVASASYSSLFEDYASSAASVSGQWEIGSNEGSFSQSISEEYHSNPRVLALALGTRLTERVSFGFSADVFLGNEVGRSDLISVLDSFPDFGTPQKATRVVRVLSLDTVKYSGFGLTGGLKYSGDRVGVGLIVRAPFSFNAESDYKTFTNVKYAGLDQPEESDTTYLDNQLLKYDLPIMVGVGVAYKLTEKLLWAFDAEYRGYEGHDAEFRIDRNLSEDTETYETVPLYWKNVFTFRTGVEYMWDTDNSMFPLVPLRLGFAYVPIPTPDIAVNLSGGDDPFSYSSTAGYTLSAGFGVWWEQVNLDLAYSFHSLDRESVYILGVDPSNFVIAPVDMKNRSHFLSVTFTGYF